ncbi:MAG: PID-CTERM protein-sorting domain-containing protein [Bacteroidales bacterium]
MKIYILTALIAICSILLNAQPIPAGGAAHGQIGNQPAGAPLDGGLSILLLLGAAYGVRKIHFKKNKKNTNTVMQIFYKFS